MARVARSRDGIRERAAALRERISIERGLCRVRPKPAVLRDDWREPVRRGAVLQLEQLRQELRAHSTEAPPFVAAQRPHCSTLDQVLRPLPTAQIDADEMRRSAVQVGRLNLELCTW